MFEYQFYVASDHPYAAARIRASLALHGIREATIQKATGLWRGTSEYSYVVTIIAHEHIMKARARPLRETLKKMLKQSDVLVTRKPIWVMKD